MPPSLCQQCLHVRVIVSGTGSRFLLCQLAREQKQFAKYPPQPVIRCEGFQQGESKEQHRLP